MDVIISARGKSRLEKTDKPVYVELELYFSCLLRKRVLFHEKLIGDGINLESGVENLIIQFRPVMTKACLVEDADIHDPDVERFPVVKGARFFPKWFRLDYSRGKWTGDFGYSGRS